MNGLCMFPLLYVYLIRRKVARLVCDYLVLTKVIER
jgi:hypothetical protein